MRDAPIDRAFARLDEGLIHYRERPASGDPGGDAESSRPPLLLLHASPNSSRSMEPIMRAYAPGRRLIAPDTPGNGDSVRPAAEQPEMADYADALDRFCATLGLAEVDIFGSHTGAHIGLELAVRNPARVRRLAVDGLLLLSDAERQEYLATYAPPQAPDEQGTQFHWAWQYIRDQMIFFPHFRKDREHLRAGGIFDPRFLHEMTLDVLRSLDTYHLAYEAVFRHELAARLDELQRPLYWLDTGEGYLDDALELVREKVTGASVVRLAHTPDDFARELSTIAGHD